MTDREIIAAQAETISWLQNRLDLLERQLAEAGLSPGALRQRRFRERHKASPNVTEALRGVTKASPPSADGVTKASPGTFKEGVTLDLLVEPPTGLRDVALEATGNDLLGSREKEEEGKETAGESKFAAKPRKRDSAPDLAPFRDVYPKTDRTSWAEVARVWATLSESDRAAAVAGAEKYSAKNPEPQFRKGAQSWLRGRRWETIDDAPAWTPSNGTARFDPQEAVRASRRRYDLGLSLDWLGPRVPERQPA